MERKRGYIKGKFNVIQNDNACNHYRKHKNSIGGSCGRSEATRLWLRLAVQGLRRHLSGSHEVGLRVASSLSSRAAGHGRGAKPVSVGYVRGNKQAEG